MGKHIQNFRDLFIGQKGMDIVKEVYMVTKQFSQQEAYGLVSQLQRSAVSIPSNVSEGFNRLHKKEYIRFLSIALGSCGELET